MRPSADLLTAPPASAWRCSGPRLRGGLRRRLGLGHRPGRRCGRGLRCRGGRRGRARRWRRRRDGRDRRRGRRCGGRGRGSSRSRLRRRRDRRGRRRGLRARRECGRNRGGLRARWRGLAGVAMDGATAATWPRQNSRLPSSLSPITCAIAAMSAVAIVTRPAPFGWLAAAAFIASSRRSRPRSRPALRRPPSLRPATPPRAGSALLRHRAGLPGGLLRHGQRGRGAIQRLGGAPGLRHRLLGRADRLHARRDRGLCRGERVARLLADGVGGGVEGRGLLLLGLGVGLAREVSGFAGLDRLGGLGGADLGVAGQCRKPRDLAQAASASAFASSASFCAAAAASIASAACCSIACAAFTISTVWPVATCASSAALLRAEIAVFSVSASEVAVSAASRMVSAIAGAPDAPAALASVVRALLCSISAEVASEAFCASATESANACADWANRLPFCCCITAARRTASYFRRRVSAAKRASSAFFCWSAAEDAAAAAFCFCGSIAAWACSAVCFCSAASRTESWALLLVGGVGPRGARLALLRQRDAAGRFRRRRRGVAGVFLQRRDRLGGLAPPRPSPSRPARGWPRAPSAVHARHWRRRPWLRPRSIRRWRFSPRFPCPRPRGPPPRRAIARRWRRARGVVGDQRLGVPVDIRQHLVKPLAVFRRNRPRDAVEARDHQFLGRRLDMLSRRLVVGGERAHRAEIGRDLQIPVEKSGARVAWRPARSGANAPSPAVALPR